MQVDGTQFEAVVNAVYQNIPPYNTVVIFVEPTVALKASIAVQVEASRYFDTSCEETFVRNTFGAWTNALIITPYHRRAYADGVVLEIERHGKEYNIFTNDATESANQWIDQNTMLPHHVIPAGESLPKGRDKQVGCVVMLHTITIYDDMKDKMATFSKLQDLTSRIGMMTRLNEETKIITTAEDFRDLTIVVLTPNKMKTKLVKRFFELLTQILYNQSYNKEFYVANVLFDAIITNCLKRM